MSDGQGTPGAADDRGGDGRRERRPAPQGLIFQELDAGGDWLAPAWGFLEKARSAVTLCTAILALLWLGARLERRMIKAGLSVVEEDAGGDRG